jgi:glycosyltransferase involved in cell wall biosynthesis
MFIITSMPVGGAETLLVNMVRRFDRNRINPMIGCLKEKGPLGEELSSEIPVFENLINHKYDVAVARRLRNLFKENKVDAVITVGAGDKMFWGRLAARYANVPVILSALHSTGWPDGVGKLNRMLTRITDGFIAVAKQHAEYQINEEKFPESKVFMIPNGIDTERFQFDAAARQTWRQKFNISETAPVVGIVAALRSEKNHPLFIESAFRTLQQVPDAQFVIAGDGPERPNIEAVIKEKQIESKVHFLGSISDIPGVLSMVDVFGLTSHNEASPVSIMEALSCRRPVVATDVGSIDESVVNGKTGFLVPAGDAEKMSQRWRELLSNQELRDTLGQQGRDHIIKYSSLQSMTDGYVELVESIFCSKQEAAKSTVFAPSNLMPWASSNSDQPLS